MKRSERQGVRSRDRLSGRPPEFVSAPAPAPAPAAAHFEPLEPRVLFSAATGDLVPVGTQPEGSLSGKIVYVHGGHGWEFNGSTWTTQRGESPNTELVEDFGNIDQMNFLVDYLWNAGATVVPLRPAGHQLNEVVLDNDDAEVTFVGSWSNSSSSVYFGTAGDTPYRFASTSPTETAYARYRPDIPEAGHYPVYAWTRAGSDRVEQLYRVHHPGGITEVNVNHRQVGNGWVYLGDYYLEAGTDAYVDISNRSDDPNGSVVIADAIRFGNGIGDSGNAREDESTLYWVQSQLGVGATGSVGGVVSASVRHAARMNRSADGSLSDRVFVSYHSNGANGSARGVLGLYNGNNNPATETPNQFLLADTLAAQVNDDLVALNGQFEHDWFDRGNSVTLDRGDIEFGEINNLYVNNEFDATIIETGFHDNLLDAQMLRDPKVRDAIARATYQGIVEYFNAVDGSTAVQDLPAPVTDLRVTSPAEGVAILNWTPPVANAQLGDPPTGYRVYQSTDGYSFDGGTFIAGGASSILQIGGLDPADGVRYYKVAAVNAAGESLSPDTVAVLPAGTDQRVLVVNGFDRNERRLNPTQNYPNPGSINTVERVRPRNSNSFDYAVQHAAAIAAYGNGLVSIDTTQNEAVADGTVDLAVYDAVVWITGEESTADSTFDADEQSALTNYFVAGGHIFATGAEIGWDLDLNGNGAAFYNTVLRADYVADDAGTYAATPAAGSIFAGGPALDFDTRDTVYNAQFPDVIAPTGGAAAALNYSGGSGGVAAIQYDGSGLGLGNVVTFGFPFETIDGFQQRNAVMADVLDFFGISNVPAATLVGDYNADGFVGQGDLDLVLLNWGDTTLPAGFDESALDGGGPFDGLLGQNELDGVLLNWGNTTPAPPPPSPNAPGNNFDSAVAVQSVALNTTTQSPDADDSDTVTPTARAADTPQAPASDVVKTTALAATPAPGSAWLHSLSESATRRSLWVQDHRQGPFVAEPDDDEDNPPIVNHLLS